MVGHWYILLLAPVDAAPDADEAAATTGDRRQARRERETLAAVLLIASLIEADIA